MSTQQDIYAAELENHPPMLNKDNYVPWSSRLVRYAKNKPNGKLIYNSIMHGPYVRRMIPEPGDPDCQVPIAKTFHEQTDEELTEKEVKEMEADDQAIQTILMGLPKEIYAAVDSCETAQEIWLRVQQMMKGYDIGLQEKKAKLFNEWERFTSTDGESIESYYHRFSELMNDFKRNKQPTTRMETTCYHCPPNKGLAYSRLHSVNVGNQNGLSVVQGSANQNGNGNVATVRAEGNGNGNNENQIRCYNCQGVDHYARNCTVKPRKRDAAYLQTQMQIAQKEEAGIQLNFEEFDFMAAVGAYDKIKEVNANCTLKDNLQQASTSGTQTDIAPVYDSDGSAQEESKFVRDFKSLANEADESLAKHKALEFVIERLLRVVVSEQKNITKGTGANTKFANQSTIGKPPSSSKSKLYFVIPFLNSKVIPRVGESNALSKPVTSNSAPSSRESTVVNNERVIALEIFRINPFKSFKKDVNSNTNGLPSTRVESTAKTKIPQSRSNPKNDRILSASKSNCPSNNLEKVEVHHRNLLFSKTLNHRSSACNNIKLVVRNDKSEVVCATCKQCLITANHDECVFKYVNGMNSSKKNQSANVSKSANQKKHKPNVKKSKKLGFDKRLASPRPSKPRTCLRWLPTGRIFYLCGKITVSSNTESESDTSVCDNASASNPQEPISKGFPNSTSFLDMFTRLWRQNICLYPLDVL
ncbi:retrovirus-related pol polyprotein from transposon TNT 1-94 [Tanacetum coccineum]